MGKAEPEPSHYGLDVWQVAMLLVRKVYDMTAGFPGEERYGLTSQIRRSAVSIPSNIAEGAARGSDRDFTRFLLIARSSVMELDTQLWLSRDLGFAETKDIPRDSVNRVIAMLNGLIRNKQSGAAS